MCDEYIGIVPLQVCLDGVDICKLEHKWLHRIVGLVGQEPVLFQSEPAHSHIIAQSKASSL
jgi:ABC-type multidrug transport system fused ATPase/permease subunit